MFFPYTLQDDLALEEYTPKIIVKAGEHVCNGKYLNQVPQTKCWYTKPLELLKTIVQMKHVVKAACTMHPNSETNKMPHNCGRTPLDGLKLDAEDDEFMLKEIHHHEVLEHDEPGTDDEVSDEENT